MLSQASPHMAPHVLPRLFAPASSVPQPPEACPAAACVDGGEEVDENPRARSDTPADAASWAAFEALVRTPTTPGFDPVGTLDLSKPLPLADVVDGIETVLRFGGGRANTLLATRALLDILRAFDASSPDWHRYKHVDAQKNYTRNLIATDDRTFSLILLCWNPQRFSPIHDHPCDGCWMRGVQGTVQEVRYSTKAGADGSMAVTGDTSVGEGEVAYVDDSVGLHKVGNPTNTLAVTLHLYCPPYGSCRAWLSPEDASAVQRPVITFHSKFGELVE